MNDGFRLADFFTAALRGATDAAETYMERWAHEGEPPEPAEPPEPVSPDLIEKGLDFTSPTYYTRDSLSSFRLNISCPVVPGNHPRNPAHNFQALYVEQKEQGRHGYDSLTLNVRKVNTGVTVVALSSRLAETGWKVPPDFKDDITLPGFPKAIDILGTIDQNTGALTAEIRGILHPVKREDGSFSPGETFEHEITIAKAIARGGKIMVGSHVNKSSESPWPAGTVADVYIGG
jgi:hypothetical protein